MRTLLLVAAASATALASARGQHRTYGIRGKVAPEWGINEWFDRGGDRKPVRLHDLRGKIVYVYCFQSWCPGCHSHGFPLLQKLVKAYGGREDVVFVALQTVFEGFETNTAARARNVAKRYDLDIPFAHDAGKDGKYSWILRSYLTGGTPWTILIDKNGVVRFNGYSSRLTEKGIRAQIDALRREKAIVGQRFGATGGLARLDVPREAWDFGEHELTLVRWWTEDCEHCAASVPALADLHDRFADRGLALLAVHHAKPKNKEVADESVVRHATRLGWRGAVARDHGWKKLDELRGRGAPSLATSVTFLVDRRGVIVWAHPGPRLYATDVSKYWWANRDMEELLAVIAERLGG